MDETVSHYSDLLCCILLCSMCSRSYCTLKVYPVAGYFQSILPVMWSSLPSVPVCLGNCHSLILSHKAASEKSKRVQALKNIHTRGVHIRPEVTSRSSTRLGGPHLSWFRLLLSSLIGLLFHLPIDFSWYPLGIACFCHSICCPSPASCKSLWHESMKKIMALLYAGNDPSVLWTCWIISPSLLSIIP